MMMKCLTLAKAVAVTMIIAPAGASADPIRFEKGQRQLFLDDHVIARMQAVKRTLNRPMKHPQNPQNPTPKKI